MSISRLILQIILHLSYQYTIATFSPVFPQIIDFSPRIHFRSIHLISLSSPFYFTRFPPVQIPPTIQSVHQPILPQIRPIAVSTQPSAYIAFLYIKSIINFIEILILPTTTITSLHLSLQIQQFQFFQNPSFKTPG